MRQIVIAILALGLPVAALAQIYQWTDASGETHFSQTPPPAGTPFKHLDPATSSGLDNGTLSTYVKQTDAQNAKTAADNEAATQVKAQRAERCAKARERINLLESSTAHRLSVTGPDGQPARMTDEQFNSELSKARTAESQNCD